MDKVEDGSIVEVAKERFERAQDFYKDSRVLSLEDTQFAMGDSDNGWQWPSDVYQNRSNIQRKPCLTINGTAQHCNQIINSIRQNRPAAKVIPVDGGADKKTAEILAGMIRSIQSASSADTAHDLAAEHAIYGGEGYWRIVTDYESYDSFNQQILIKQIANPRLVYIDPDCKEADRSDARWGFVFEDKSRAVFQEEYPDQDFSSWGDQDPKGWVRKDTIRIAEYFYCEYVPDELYLLENGVSVLKSQLEDGEKVEGDYLVAQGVLLAIRSRRTTQRKQWKWCKLIGGSDKPHEERDWPGSYLPIITVVGKELNVDGYIVRKGIVRDLKDPARMVNYSYSAAVETLALQNKVPYLASAEAIDGFEDIWGAANLENRAYLPYNAFTQDNQQISPPQRQMPAVMPSAQVQMLQLSTEEMRAASGQQNANFGIKSEAQSGIGIQRLKVQGEIATLHFPDNLIRALKYEAKVLVDLIPKVYDTARVVRILGMDGKEKPALIEPGLKQAHQEGGAQDYPEVKEIFNPTVGKYDVSIDTGPSFQTQRQEAAAALTELASRNPALMQIAGDLIIRSYDFPGADAIATRIEKTIPPNIKEGAENDIASMAQQLQQMGKQLEQGKMLAQKMDQHIQQLEKEKEGKVLERETQLMIAGMKRETETEKQEDDFNIERYKAETERMKVLEPAMTPEALAPLVQQALFQILGTPKLEQEPEEGEQGGGMFDGMNEDAEHTMKSQMRDQGIVIPPEDMSEAPPWVQENGQ